MSDCFTESDIIKINNSIINDIKSLHSKELNEAREKMNKNNQMLTCSRYRKVNDSVREMIVFIMKRFEAWMELIVLLKKICIITGI